MVSGVSGLVGGSVDEVAEILGPQTFAITAVGASFRQKRQRRKNE
jgi:hypothetical protein